MSAPDLQSIKLELSALAARVESAIRQSATRDTRQRPRLPSKGECLAHYAEREPAGFLQLDGFDTRGGGDCVMTPDADGDTLFAGGTTELMDSPVAVRVLVRSQDTVQVARMLHKMADWLQRDKSLMEYLPRADAKGATDELFF